MLYVYQNAPIQTTAAPSPVTTGAVIKTLLQLSFNAGVQGRIKEWGINFNGSTAGVPGVVELIETTVAATVTAAVTADITRLDAKALLLGDPTTALINVGTAATGYTASVEGSVTTVRNLDGPQQIAPTNQFIHQFPLGDEPEVQAGKFVRIRVTFAVAVSALCYIKFEI